ncbi:sulfite exporter TauE/SafE family protein [Desulforhabdus amnigena]|uniref:Membrane protein n=1 Tax=Desulforhabdus amnigena TaxID=40218 RepID=A0A9W6LB25_9BACT|nr:sulfite exporter TauE/SafE family protein [Desulforhabdus amnigena]NLJ29886.1 sulfite exporter TauE/SafE family protein [Deltaproteobacteria bacterium]GLI36241.1 membrane protein [Desulforhabdus amnigena]
MFSFFPLSIGLLGSLHCLGMCGPLVLAYSLHLQSQSDTATKFSTFPARLGLFHHIAFHIGRLATYGILGALAAGLFRAVDLTRIFFSLRSGMSYVAGSLLVFLGLMLLRAIPLPAFLTSVSLGPGSFFGRCFPPLFRSQTVLSKLLLGMATGLIPCCLSWAMIVTAASTQNPMQGFITMVLFGAGTVPALFFTGLSASFLSRKVRFLGEKVAAVSIIFMGIVLILQGAQIIA